GDTHDLPSQVCAISAILAAFNPATVGAFCWDSLPIVRLVMSALVTSDFSSPSTPENDAFEEEERNRIEAIAAVDDRFSDIRSFAIVDPHLATRPLPSDFLEFLVQLDGESKLGDKLRRSSNPNFFENVINSQSYVQSARWLSGLINGDPE